ncbi:MAG: hypothetical protein ACI8TQ_001711 [Planctomycetota bacterium]|jgi:hypothetical protein
MILHRLGSALRSKSRIGAILCASFVGLQCAESDSNSETGAEATKVSSTAKLVDITTESGINFVHDNGHRETYYFPETVGSGVATCDFDADGDVDVYAIQCGRTPGGLVSPAGTPTNQLFAGRGDGTFQDVTDGSGAAAHDGYGMGVCAGDVNGDGLLDMFLTNTGPDALLINRGNLSFSDEAEGTPLADPRWTTGCGFADLDNDGHLDLVVCAYVDWAAESEQVCHAGGFSDYCHVSLYPSLSDKVWKGDGTGKFVDVTAQSDLNQRTGRGFGLALLDFDRDGDIDLYVANDSVENHFYLNENGALRDRTNQSGAAYNLDGLAEAGMGVIAGDFDGNAVPDLLITNFAGESNTVYLNQSGGYFRDVSRQTGITAASRPALGFGVVLGDLDRDGAMDLVVSNGHVMRNAGREGSPWRFAQPDHLFRGKLDKSSLRFELWDAGDDVLGVPRVGRGSAVGDLDNDGQLDIVMLASGGPLTVVHNQLALPDSRWLKVKLRGLGSNTSAIGAMVMLDLSDKSIQRRWIQSGTGFLSQNELASLFAIPPGTRASKVRVRWPDGTQSSVRVKGANKTIEIVQGE